MDAPLAEVVQGAIAIIIVGAAAVNWGQGESLPEGLLVAVTAVFAWYGRRAVDAAKRNGNG